MTAATTNASAATIRPDPDPDPDPDPTPFSPPAVLEEEEEEEEECVSALQLVGGQFGSENIKYRCILGRATRLTDVLTVPDYGCEEEEVFQ